MKIIHIGIFIRIYRWTIEIDVLFSALVASSAEADDDIIFSDPNLKNGALLKPYRDKSLKDGEFKIFFSVGPECQGMMIVFYFLEKGNDFLRMVL